MRLNWINMWTYWEIIFSQWKKPVVFIFFSTLIFVNICAWLFKCKVGSGVRLTKRETSKLVSKWLGRSNSKYDPLWWGEWPLRTPTCFSIAILRLRSLSKMIWWLVSSWTATTAVYVRKWQYFSDGQAQIERLVPCSAPQKTEFISNFQYKGMFW